MFHDFPLDPPCLGIPWWPWWFPPYRWRRRLEEELREVRFCDQIYRQDTFFICFSWWFTFRQQNAAEGLLTCSLRRSHSQISQPQVAEMAHKNANTVIPKYTCKGQWANP